MRILKVHSRLYTHTSNIEKKALCKLSLESIDVGAILRHELTSASNQ